MPFRARFGAGVRFKIFFAPYLFRLSTLVLEVQHYLLFLIQPYLGLVFTFLGPSGLFFGPSGLFSGSESGLTIILRPTNVDYQFLFLNYSPIFLSSIQPNLALFAFLGPFRAILGLESGSKTFFGTYLHRLTTFILEV